MQNANIAHKYYTCFKRYIGTPKLSLFIVTVVYMYETSFNCIIIVIITFNIYQY